MNKDDEFVHTLALKDLDTFVDENGKWHPVGCFRFISAQETDHGKISILLERDRFGKARIEDPLISILYKSFKQAIKENS